MAAKTEEKSSKKSSDNNQYKFVVARTDDGTVQVTVSIPYSIVQSKKEEALKHLIENLEVPGFRKGKAPTDVASKHIDTKKLYEHTLQYLLPEIYEQAIKEYSLKPIINPKFELVSADEGKDWNIRVITSELPEVNLGDYKKTVKEAGKTESIWVPGKDSSAGQDKKKTQEEKEQLVIKTLLENIQLNVPKLLVEDEVNHKLSQLLDQVQKLGLTIDQYLSSTGKNIEQVRNGYQHQAQDTLKLLLILNKIADEEKIEVEDKEIENIAFASDNALGQAKEKKEISQEQKNYIKSILLRRKALDSLASLV